MLTLTNMTDLMIELSSRNTDQVSPLSLIGMHLGSDTTLPRGLYPYEAEKLCQVIGMPCFPVPYTTDVFALMLETTLPPRPWMDDFIFENPTCHVAESLSYLQLFTLVISLASNKVMSYVQIQQFVAWLSDEEFRDLLTPLFKLRTQSVIALAEVLVDAAARHQPGLIEYLSKAGVPSECILRALGFTKDPAFVDFFASEFDLQMLTEESKTMLLASAVAAGKVCLVHSLLLGNANVNLKGPMNAYSVCSPLIEAVNAQRLDLVELLLENGANVNQQCECSQSPYFKHNALSSAVKSQNLKMSEYLLKNGAQICERFEDIFHVKFDDLPQRLCDLLKLLAGKSLKSGQDIIEAAQNQNLLKDFFQIFSNSRASCY